jgi:hypothetical protein
MNAQIERLPGHGEAMDRMYRFQRHFYDVTRRYYLLGRDQLLDRLAPPPDGSTWRLVAARAVTDWCRGAVRCEIIWR